MMKRFSPLSALLLFLFTAVWSASSVSSAMMTGTVFHRVQESGHDLLESSLSIHFTLQGKSPISLPQDQIIPISDHPDWIVPSSQNPQDAYLNAKAIALALPDILSSSMHTGSDAYATQTSDASMQLNVSGSPHAGFRFDSGMIAEAVSDAINHGSTTVTIPLAYDPGILYAYIDGHIESLALLSEGRSNFEGSPPGRAANVQMALNEYVNGSYIPADKTFSFNAALDGSSGWFNSLIIIDGHELTEAPGGGICQAATTLFRAAELAGIPVVSRANHSLYVSYYEDYGVGLDATVLPPKQDLKLQNDTGNPLVILAHTSGNDAFVDLYGVSDGRSVTLDGPYFSKNTPDELFNGQALHINQIGWRQAIRYADGHAIENDIVSQYTALPRTLASKYLNRRGTAELIGDKTATGQTMAMLVH